MKKLVVVAFVFLAIFVGGFAFAQNPFEKTTETAIISDKNAMSIMNKYADQDKEKLIAFMKQEKKNHIALSYVSAKQALEVVNKIGRQKVLIDKNAVIVNGKIVPNYIIVIPE
jgi:hypothetical protein